MSLGWKMGVSAAWSEGEMFTTIHLTEKGAFIASIQDMVEMIHGGVHEPEGFRDPGDLKVYNLLALHQIWDEMQEYFIGTRNDFDVQEVKVAA